MNGWEENDARLRRSIEAHEQMIRDLHEMIERVSGLLEHIEAEMIERETTGRLNRETPENGREERGD